MAARLRPGLVHIGQNTTTLANGSESNDEPTLTELAQQEGLDNQGDEDYQELPERQRGQSTGSVPVNAVALSTVPNAVSCKFSGGYAR